MIRRFDSSRLLVATHNAGKLAEIKALLAPYGTDVVSAGDLGLPEPVEDGTTFVENARIKAHSAAKATGLVALSDDSGIEIDALDKAPGVYTADWAETGNGRDFTMAMTKTHNLLEAKSEPHPRTARFCCTLVMAWPDGHDEVFAGQMAGEIVWPMRGDRGHGYDPIFQPKGYNITFGQMDAKVKNRISHRADAFARLLAGCFA